MYSREVSRTLNLGGTGLPWASLREDCVVRSIAAVTVALLVGASLGVAGSRLLGGDAALRPALIREGTLATLPRAPVGVRAERVVLRSGFRSRHRHGGPTFNFVEAGRVAIADGRVREVHGAGDFFFEPADRPHSISVLEGATLNVVRLLPPGAPATTELP